MLKINFTNEDGRTASALAQPIKTKKRIICYEVVLTLPPVGRQRKPRTHKSTLSTISTTYPVESLVKLACRLVNAHGGKEGWIVTYNDSQAEIAAEMLERVTEIVKPKVTPHKGGRTVSINIRVTPETHQKLKALGTSISDWIEAKINEDV